MERIAKRLEDGVLAGSTCFIAGDITAQNANMDGNPVISQLLIPVITGLVVPFIKELIMDLRERRRERKKAKKEALEAK